MLTFENPCQHSHVLEGLSRVPQTSHFRVVKDLWDQRAHARELKKLVEILESQLSLSFALPFFLSSSLSSSLISLCLALSLSSLSLVHSVSLLLSLFLSFSPSLSLSLSLVKDMIELYKLQRLFVSRMCQKTALY